MITHLQCVCYSKTKHLKINQILKLKIKSMELEKFEYDNSIVKKFIIVTALFSLVGMLVDLKVASQLAWAGFFLMITSLQNTFRMVESVPYIPMR